MGWKCKSCGKTNVDGLDECLYCDAEAPSIKERVQSKTKTPKNGDVLIQQPMDDVLDTLADESVVVKKQTEKLPAKKKKPKLIIVLLIVLVAVLSVKVVFLLNNRSKKQVSSNKVVSLKKDQQYLQLRNNLGDLYLLEYLNYYSKLGYITLKEIETVTMFDEEMVDYTPQNYAILKAIETKLKNYDIYYYHMAKISSSRRDYDVALRLLSEMQKKFPRSTLKGKAENLMQGFINSSSN
jgi:hypothetical protein